MITPTKQQSYSLSFLEGLAHRKFSSHLTKTLTNHNLSIPEWKLLGQLLENGSLKLADIAQLLSVEPPLVTALVDRLEKNDFVKRQHDAKDHRAKIIQVTGKGLRVMEEIEPQIQETIQELLKGITQEELTKYMKVMTTIIANE